MVGASMNASCAHAPTGRSRRAPGTLQMPARACLGREVRSKFTFETCVRNGPDECRAAIGGNVDLVAGEHNAHGFFFMGRRGLPQLPWARSRSRIASIAKNPLGSAISITEHYCGSLVIVRSLMTKSAGINGNSWCWCYLRPVVTTSGDKLQDVSVSCPVCILAIATHCQQSCCDLTYYVL